MKPYRQQGQSKEDYRKTCSANGTKGGVAKFKNNKGDVVRAPGYKEPLYRVRILDLTRGCESEIMILQGRRTNNYFAQVHGKCGLNPVDMHKIWTQIAKRLVPNWLQI